MTYDLLFTFCTVLFREVPDNVPIYVEATANKIFLCFPIYTVQVKELKEFCEFVDTEYKHSWNCKN